MEILTAALVFAGAFFGTYLANAYNAEGTITGEANNIPFYWRVSAAMPKASCSFEV